MHGHKGRVNREIYIGDLTIFNIYVVYDLIALTFRVSIRLNQVVTGMFISSLLS